MLRRFDTEGLPTDVAVALQGKSEWAYTIARDHELQMNLRTFHERAAIKEEVYLDGVCYSEQALFSALASDGTLIAARTRRKGREDTEQSTYAVLLDDIRSPGQHEWRESDVTVTSNWVEILLSKDSKSPVLTLIDGPIPIEEQIALFAEAQIVAAAERRHARRIHLTHFCLELLQNGYEHLPTQSTEELLNEVALLSLKGIRPDSDRSELLTFTQESDTM